MAEATAKLSARPVWDCKGHAAGQGAVEAGRSGFLSRMVENRSFQWDLAEE